MDNQFLINPYGMLFDEITASSLVKIDLAGNKLDTDNRIAPGTLRLPRQSWRIRAGGSAGTSHVIAVVSRERTEPLKDISGDASPFASAPTEGAVFRNLFIEATGASGGQGRFGASAPISIQETSQ